MLLGSPPRASFADPLRWASARIFPMYYLEVERSVPAVRNVRLLSHFFLRGPLPPNAGTPEFHFIP